MKYRRTSHLLRCQSLTFVPSLTVIDKTVSLEKQARQIRLLLETLGPYYSCLSLYLSSRIDLFPAEFCREFALTPDIAPPLSPLEIQRILKQEYGSDSHGAFREFNYVPCQSTILDQSHSALLTNGQPVMVVFLRPEHYVLQNVTDLPASFNKKLVGRLFPFVTEDVFIDFSCALIRKSNFALRSETLMLMASKNTAPNLFCIPKVSRELLNSRMITLERLEGLTLDREVHARPGNIDATAYRLCQAWLQQTLLGEGFPVDPQSGNIAILAQSPFYFSGCDLAILPAGSKENLWNYLMATTADDPDRATMYLLQEMWPSRNKKLDMESFRSKFRQAAYFGALEPVLGTDSNALPQLVFQHWKTMLDHGYTPKPALLNFYRGLFSIARIAHTLSPLRDSLREGLEQVRINQTMKQVLDLGDWRYWSENFDKFAAALIAFPKALDDSLTRATAMNQDIQPVTQRDSPDARHQNLFLGTITTLCAALIVLAFTWVIFPSIRPVVMLLAVLGGILTIRELTE